MPEVATKEKTKYIAELEMCREKNGRRFGKIFSLDPLILETESDSEAIKTAEEYVWIREYMQNKGLAVPNSNTAVWVAWVKSVRNQTNKRIAHHVGHVASNY